MQIIRNMATGFITIQIDVFLFLNSEGKQNRISHYVMCVFLNKKNISTVRMYGDEIIGDYLGLVCFLENVKFTLSSEIGVHKFRVLIIIRLCRDK